ncbi:hypothetical protein D3C75_1318450 [compost metagenome]
MLVAHSFAIIGDGNEDSVALLSGGEDHGSSIHLLHQSVADGILHNWLHNQRWQ